MEPVTIIGLGNLLLGDDGIGPRVVQGLLNQGLPPGVDAVEGGAVFYHYFDVFTRSSHVLAVDAFLGGGSPGTVYLVAPGGIRREQAGLWHHEDGFPAVIDIMASYGLRPRVSIIGVEPAETGWSLDLSREVAAKLTVVVRIAAALANRLRRGFPLWPPCRHKPARPGDNSGQGR